MYCLIQMNDGGWYIPQFIHTREAALLSIGLVLLLLLKEASPGRK